MVSPFQLRRQRPLRSWTLGYRTGLITVGAVLAVGTAGFMWIESWNVFDAFYMTVITLSTVGFGEVQPLSPAGRAFATALILGGVAILGYVLRSFAERLMETPRRRLARRIRRMDEHIIICGFGRIGQQVAAGLRQHGKEVCVIEETTEGVEAARRQDLAVIQGDATSEETLEQAGLRRAAGIVAVLPHDGHNLSITMTAKALRPEIRVIARSEEERSRANLERAGAEADDVISPHRAASRVVVRSLCRPRIQRLLRRIAEPARRGFGIGEIPVTPDSGLAGKTIAESALGEDRVVLVLAIESEGKERSIAPRGHTRLASGDTLIVMGEVEDLTALGANPEEIAVEPG